MDFWDDLIAFIRGGKVIPIIGQDLLTIEVAGRPILLYSHLARLLAKELGIDPAELGGDFTINDVVCRYVQGGKPPVRAYLRLNSILQGSSWPIPEPLRQLARIKPFQLFVSTTFDPLMERALAEERFAGAERAQERSYAPNKKLDEADLPRDHGTLRLPFVFHLFGKASEATDFAVTEEDVLEFVAALQVDERRPNRLFDELRGNHLLLIGNSFPDWLARFFIRLTKGERLSAGVSNQMQYFADERGARDRNLVLFLKNFGRAHLEIVDEAGPVDFVRQLAEKWAERGSPQAAVPEGEADAMAQNAIFISYAREDERAAIRIAEILEAAGLSVWRDRTEIEAGEIWMKKIERNIFRASLFVAVISATTHRRPDGVFQTEWNLARQCRPPRPDEVFILPVRVDDSPVPENFRDLHCECFPGGELSNAFVRSVAKAVDKIKNRERTA